MDNAGGSREGHAKKAPLDSLSKEELIQKFKGALAIAQKAKQAKDEYAEENKRLKEELSKFETQKDADKKSLVAMKEIVDALMENKLSLTTQLADQNKKLQNQIRQFEEVSIENEALKRQLKRLSDENEELLADLDSMEKKLEQVNKFGKQQKKDLVLLEKETEKWQNLELSVEELQKELKQVSAEKILLQEKLDESNTKNKLNETNSELLIKLKSENEELLVNTKTLTDKTQNIVSFEKTIEMQGVQIEQLKKCNEKLTARLYLFKTKVVEFSLKLKKLKKSREILIETVKEYAQSVPKWHKEIMNASDKISSQLLFVDTERRRLEGEVSELKEQLKNNNSNSKSNSAGLDRVQMQELCSYASQAYTEYLAKVEDLRIKSQENLNLQAEMEILNESLIKCELDNEEKSRDIEGLRSDILGLTEKVNKSLGNNLGESIVNEELKEKLCQTCLDYAEKVKDLELTKENLNDVTINYQKVIEENTERTHEIRQLVEELEVLKNEKKSFDDSLNQLENDLTSKSSQLKNLEQERNDILTSLEKTTTKLEKVQSALSLRETENSDLLAEMRELNEALKGRGDVISRQQDKIKELEQEVRQNSEKLSNIETNLTEKTNQIIEKDSQIKSMNKEISTTKGEVSTLLEQAKQNEERMKSLSSEMSSMRERYHDGQSDAISTSTISRVEDIARMREVDESLDEKYSKLRALALKLKKKVQEQAAHIATLESEGAKTIDEKNEITTKLKVKNLQALQNENDKLLDEIDHLKQENNAYDKQIKSLESELACMKNASTSEKSSKAKYDGIVKELQSQIKSLKQEKESFNLVRKEIEKERDSLKIEIEKKMEEFNALKVQCDKLKTDVNRKKSAEKQSSVLNLEIEAYEKSLNDVTKKLERCTSTISELKEEVLTKDAYIQSLKAQIKLLEENIESEKTHSLELKQQIDLQHTKLKESEHEKLELRTQLESKTQESEDFKSEVNELQLQLSTIASDREKLCASLQTEKEALMRNVVSLEENLNSNINKLKATGHELEDLRAEYTSYKIKAQAVLRQNQSKESSRERELEDELTACQNTIDSLTTKLNHSSEIIGSHEKKIEEMQQDNDRIQKRAKELIQILEESRLQNEQLLEDNRKQTVEYQESLKSHRLQIETLNTCYKSQIEDLEKKHKSELDELRKRGTNHQKSDGKPTSRLGPFGGPTNDEQKIDLILMEREDAEGSETTSNPGTRRKTSTTKSRRDVIPLDELLNSSLDDIHDEQEFRPISPTVELQQTKDKLHKQESQVKHLTALLAESEQDLAKLTQLNELLKEEVRRQERSVEREQHIQNSEYLKNVVLKFVTLNSGDERTRLVPVLNTILKLSPEETQALQNVAKGGDGITRSWGSYLPIWSNHQ